MNELFTQRIIAIVTRCSI